MILPLIIAIWFGISAHKGGRNWFGWALAGAALSFVVTTLVRKIGILIFGPFSSIDAAGLFIVISTVIAIGITVWVGWEITSTHLSQPAERKRKQDRYYARPPGGAEVLCSLAQLRDGYEKGHITTGWTARRDGEIEAKPVADILEVQSQMEK